MDLSTTRKPDTPTRDIVDQLERDPGRFEPVTALRIAQAVSEGELDIAAPTGVAPAPLAVAGFKRGKAKRAVLRSAFAGLTGPLGAMPQAYNDLIMREERNRSRALAGFFDLFSARMAELFADACEKYRLARRMRWGADRRHNAFVTALLSLAGFGTRRLRDREGVDEDLVLRFSGFFAARNRNAASLQAMLQEFSGLPVEIELFRGRWLAIPQAERSRMSGAQPVQLGVNATAGAAIQDFSGGFRVVVGPLAYADYLSLTPGGPNITALFELIRLYVGAALNFDIQVVLKKEDVPFCQLGGAGEADLPRLGWNSWARVAPAGKDSADAILKEPPAAETLSIAGGAHAA